LNSFIVSLLFCLCYSTSGDTEIWTLLPEHGHSRFIWWWLLSLSFIQEETSPKSVTDGFVSA